MNLKTIRTMKLTGKLKTNFEKWYFQTYLKGVDNSKNWYIFIREFYELPLSMRFGVWVDFYLSEGIDIVAILSGIRYNLIKKNWNNLTLLEIEIKARKQALIKAQEIYNR